MDLSAAVEALRAAIADLQAIYVFGSVATGQERPDSDVDLAVLASRPLEGEARWRLQEGIAAGLGRDVDLVDLRAASTVMQVQVLRTGRLLFEPEGSGRALFEATVLGAYTRLNFSRAGILADVKARGVVHDERRHG
jgi:predicted nucleotidyltransferase